MLSSWNRASLGLTSSGPAVSTIADWAANTSVAQNELRVYQYQVYRAKTAFTTGAVFSAANWDLVGPGLILSATIDADVTVTGTSAQPIAAMALTLPVLNRPVLLELTGPALTHTAAQASATFTVQLWDVTSGGPVSFANVDYPTAGRWSNSYTARALIPAATPSRVYQMYTQAVTAGTTTVRTSGGMAPLLTATQL